MATLTPAVPKSSLVRNVGAALAVAGLVMLGEYFFRHYVLFWMPTFGTLLVNDMLALFLAYSLLTVGFGLATQVNWRQELIGLGQAFREFTTSWNYVGWIFAIMLSLVVLPAVDQLLWAPLRLPMVVSTYRNPDILFASLAPVLKVIALVCVNGACVPIAEEYLWRGLVQARLLRVLPVAWSIGITAVLFSLKHVLVDASLGRFLTLVAFGAICGIVAQRHTWRSSAALHLFVNTATTVVALALGLQ